jgi:1-acyl-sn-glycerol-3-phosphate acyltransferase
MFKPIYELPVLNFIFRTGGAIPICSRKHDEKAYERAMDEIAEGLEQGHLLCIFPEGKLTQDGKIDEFKPGIEKILSRTPVPVIPMALQGLWGSFFSHRGGVFKEAFRPRWRNIKILAEQPVPPEQVTAPILQQKVANLRENYP